MFIVALVIILKIATRSMFLKRMLVSKLWSLGSRIWIEPGLVDTPVHDSVGRADGLMAGFPSPLRKVEKAQQFSTHNLNLRLPCGFGETYKPCSSSLRFLVFQACPINKSLCSSSKTRCWTIYSPQHHCSSWCKSSPPPTSPGPLHGPPNGSPVSSVVCSHPLRAAVWMMEKNTSVCSTSA